MKSSVMRDLEAIRDENLDLLAAGDVDIERLLAWGGQRELVFARLQEMELQLPWSEQATARSLIKEILELDASILTRVQQTLATLTQRRAAMVRMEQALGSNGRFFPSILVERVA
jgi:Flagellar protein FliT